MSAISELADEAAAELADQAVEQVMEMLETAPANAGQESLCQDMAGDVESAWMDVYNGSPPIEIKTPHPEAVGEIADAASEILTTIAEVVKELRQAAQVGDWAGAGGGGGGE